MIRAGTRATTSPVFAAALTARCPRCNARAGVECRTGVPRLFALVTAIVLLFFGCIR